MSRDTVRSLPGMARAERTTVSPGPAATSRCSPTLIMESAESGSPWLPDTNTTARPPPSPVSEPGEIRAPSERRRRPRSSATSALSTMRRPRKATGRRARTARSATRWMRGIDVAKQETSTRPRVRARTSSNAGRTASSPPVSPGCSTFVLSESRASTPRSPHCGERVDVGALVGRRRGVDLEVAARQHDPGRRLDREGEAVEDAVGDPDGVHPEGTDLHRLAGDEGAQVGVDAALLEPLAREAEGEAAAVDGRRRGLQGVGERADVILVAVGEEDPAEPPRALDQVLEVGNDRVDSRHLGRREQHSGVEQQEVLVPLQHERVEAELTEPAEGTSRTAVVSSVSLESSPRPRRIAPHGLPDRRQLHNR